ncbi:MAG TPA: ABC transporter substrate-binding protein [Candidatus Binatia bacterium]|nr:ABC transporter substrate-binding protein [Candidatus Binatia bacterium]
MRRASFIGIAAASAATGFVPAHVSAQTATLKVATLPIDQGAQAYFAQDLKFFARAGLTVDVQTLKYGQEIAAAVAGGSINIGQSNITSLAVAYERGLPFKMIAAAGLFNVKKSTSYFLVAKNSPITVAKDLNGKTVACNGLKNITQLSVQLWVDKNGGDSSTMKFVEMTFPEMEPALVANRVDAALMATPDATTALDLGRTRVLSIPFDALGHEWLIGAWFARTDWISANADVVKKFVGVMRETAAWANNPKNHAQSAAILEKYTQVRVGSANRIAFADKLDPAQIQPQIDTAARYKVLKTAFSASDLIAAVQ